MALFTLLSIPLIFLFVFLYLLSKLTKQSPKKYNYHFAFLTGLLGSGIVTAPLATAVLNHLQETNPEKLTTLITQHYYVALLLSPIPLGTLVLGLLITYFWRKPKG